MSIVTTALTRVTAAAVVGVGLAAGVAAAAAPAQAAPPPPQRGGAVQIFGPYSHQACTDALANVKGAYAIPPIRQAHGWHEGGSFSGCHQVRGGGWAFTLTAPRVHR